MTSRPLNLLVLKKQPSRAKPARPRLVQIEQIDLEELYLLARRKREAIHAWKVKRDQIVEKLLVGTPVEAGVHTAELEWRIRLHSHVRQACRLKVG